jgi:hypothetical protein
MMRSVYASCEYPSALASPSWYTGNPRARGGGGSVWYATTQRGLPHAADKRRLRCQDAHRSATGGRNILAIERLCGQKLTRSNCRDRMPWGHRP